MERFYVLTEKVSVPSQISTEKKKLDFSESQGGINSYFLGEMKFFFHKTRPNTTIPGLKKISLRRNNCYEIHVAVQLTCINKYMGRAVRNILYIMSWNFDFFRKLISGERDECTKIWPCHSKLPCFECLWRPWGQYSNGAKSAAVKVRWKMTDISKYNPKF